MARVGRKMPTITGRRMTDWARQAPGMSEVSGRDWRTERDRSDSLAVQEGLEPPTFALGKRCSILLSY